MLLRGSLAQLQRLAVRLVARRSSSSLGSSSFGSLQRASQRAGGRAPWAAVAAGVPPPAGHRRLLVTSAMQEARPGSGASEPDLAAAEQDLQLPTHCSGCGVPLQRDDPDAAG